MAAVGKGPHFLQKNPPIEFSGYGPGITVNAANCHMYLKLVEGNDRRSLVKIQVALLKC